MASPEHESVRRARSKRSEGVLRLLRTHIRRRVGWNPTDSSISRRCDFDVRLVAFVRRCLSCLWPAGLPIVTSLYRSQFSDELTHWARGCKRLATSHRKGAIASVPPLGLKPMPVRSVDPRKRNAATRQDSTFLGVLTGCAPVKLNRRAAARAIFTMPVVSRFGPIYTEIGNLGRSR